MTEEKEDSLKGVPKMNLMNFEDPEFEESKYVLTSPRSLEACSRLSVKPVDLLYKPLAEFQEELLPQDVPLRTIYNIYDEYEQNRERKLALCREERQRINEEEKAGVPCKRKPVVTKSKKATTVATKTQARKSRLVGKKQLSKSDQEINKGSMQRQRTAWATSVGHQRITNDDINTRVKDLHEESVKLREELLSRKEARAGQRRKKKVEATGTQASVTRSYSASDLSLAGTSILNKTGIAEARPLTSKKLRKALGKNARLSSAPITPRDEKILELMMCKQEDEKSQSRERVLRDLVWERQRKEEEAARLAADMKRRRLLAEEKRIKGLEKHEQAAQRKQQERTLQAEFDQRLAANRRQWQSRYEGQQKHRVLKAAQNADKQSLKKRLQESNVKVLEHDEEEMKDLLREKQEHTTTTAAQRKQAKVLEESMRVLMHNRNERNKFESRWKELLKETQESIDALAMSMEAKDSQHKTKFDQIQQRREHELTLNRLDREKKALQAKLAQQQQENEMEEWRDNILSSREVAEQHAQETMAEVIERKARKAHKERVNKERDQKRNIRKIQQEVRQWKRLQEDRIESKDRKSDLVRKEREVTIQQSRQIAATSQKLRDSLRKKYGGETFDQKAFKAEQFNRMAIGNTFLSAERNASNVKLRKLYMWH